MKRIQYHRYGGPEELRVEEVALPERGRGQTLVEAEQGVSIVPACVRNMSSNGVRFYRLQPDDASISLVAAWKKETPSPALRAFLDLVNANAAQIRKKAELL